MKPPRRVRDRLKRASFRLFSVGDRLGIHVLPKHYYTSVADYAWLRRNRALWQWPASLVGVRWDLDAQLEWLERICRRHYAEVERLERYAALAAESFGPGYGPIESQVLHCFVRSQAPRRVVEVGGGVSTAVIAEAAERNRVEGRAEARITTVEPSPSEALRRLAGVELVRAPVQQAPVALFEELGEGDLLFIDSSHAVKTGSEVSYLYLEIVPRLRPGVVVHVHDVSLPYLYSPAVLDEYIDPQESVLVLALLTNNDRLEVLCSLSALHHERPEALRAILPDYRPQPMRAGIQQGGEGHFPSSLWLRTR